jgi:conjugal transfer pilus assembly protein TraB
MNILSTLQTHQKQKFLYWSCIGGVSTLVCLVVWNVAFAGSFSGETHSPAPTEKILTGAGRLNPQDAWNERMTSQIQNQDKEIQGLRQGIEKLTETLSKQFAQRSSDSVSPSAGQQLNASLTNGLNTETGQVNNNSLTGTMLTASLPGASLGGLESGERESGSEERSEAYPGDKKKFRSKGISKQLIALHNSKLGKNLETVDNTIPAGSFAQGILLSGVDAATSTSASANPEPVLIELTDSGDLSRHFTSTVKGCRVTASSFGVLSKERVMMRLEKLSCIEVETGEVMVADVDGYVSGEDGKLGLRGTVVDRAGDHVRAAMVGGFLSSFGNFLAGAANPVTFAPNTGFAQVTPMSRVDQLKQGGAKGVSGALDKYTEFYIKRAEQLEPVIQIGAGRVVQVVFNKTASIGKSAIKKAISTKNDRVRTQTLESHSVDD